MKESNNPLVSVVMPVYNVGRFVVPAVMSVLESTYTNIELIIVDDGCTDDTISLINEISDDRVLVKKNTAGKGYVDALNFGICSATGDYIMSADGDDLVAKERIEMQVAYLERNVHYGAVCGLHNSLTHSGQVIDISANTPEKERDITQELQAVKLNWHHCTYLVRKEFMKQVRHRKWFVSGSDLDFQFRLAEITRIKFIPKVCFYYRLNPESITHTQSNNQREFFEKMAFEFARQRKICGEDELAQGAPPEIPAPDNQINSAKKQAAGKLLGVAWRCKNNGQYIKAIAAGFKSVVYDPSNLKSFLVLLIKAKE